MYVNLLAGHWDEAERLGDELLAGDEHHPGKEFVHLHLADLMLKRGELDSRARALRASSTPGGTATILENTSTRTRRC